MCLGRIDPVRVDTLLGRCAACRLHGADAPRLYIKEGVDGLGSRLHDIIAGMAMANHAQLALGGVVYGRKVCQESHGLHVLQAAGSFFGIGDPRLMFVQHGGPAFNQSYPRYVSLERGVAKFGRPKPNSSIFLPGHCLACELDQRGNASWWYTPKLLRALRESFVWTRPLAFKTGVPSIAIHVRRGDVELNKSAASGPQAGNNWDMRGVSDEWYFSLIAQVLSAHVPGADLHVFSSLEGHWNSSDFDGYRARGATVHLDGDPMEVWAHFAAADVLVMAKSSFSQVPALLNDNCVIYQPYMHLPLDGWVSAQANDAQPLDTEAAEKLGRCVASKMGKKAEPALEAA